MPGYQARKLERTPLVEMPEDFRTLSRTNAFCVRIVVFHVWILLHQFGVLVVVRDARQCKFMFEGSLVLNDEMNLLTSFHAEVVWREAAPSRSCWWRRARAALSRAP